MMGPTQIYRTGVILFFTQYTNYDRMKIMRGDDIVKLIVYDESIETFRDLNESNYNDDIVCGTVFLEREALKEIEKYFSICGFVLIDKKYGYSYPIDIHKDKIVLFEGTYNCMPTTLKNALIRYNITSLPERIWSAFFFRWQFMCDYNAFEEYGSFIKLCSNILRLPNRYNAFIAAEISVYEPATYKELCEFTRNILNLSGVNVFECDYYKSVKYLIDSLIKGYHINFAEDEILDYCMEISKQVDKMWEE